MIIESECQIIYGDNRDVLKQFHQCFDLIMTSPPYADARKSHYDSVAPKDYPNWLATFHPVFWQVLKPTGNLIINIKDKIVEGTRCHYVWKSIEQLEQLGWNCIDDYVWTKPNPIPGRWPTRLKDGWEYCFHLSKTKKPYFNADAVRIHDKGSLQKFKLKSIHYQYTASKTGSGFYFKKGNVVGKTTALPSNVILLSSVNYNTGHPAAFPQALPEFFIKLLTPEKGLVLDPFAGSGTTAMAAAKLGRKCILIDNKKDYCQLAYQHLKKEILDVNYIAN